MLIKEVCERCNLTKKAIEYYEAKNLITPRILENGYRDYSESDLTALREIAVLRECDIGIAEIRGILNSSDKPAALSRCRYTAELRMQRLYDAQKRIDSLMNDYDIEREFRRLQIQDDKDFYTIKEKLALAFPGDYGLFLSMHFGRFLNETVDTDEKRNAYKAIVNYLDNLELDLPPELSELLKVFFDLSGKIDMVKIEGKTNEKMMEALADTTAYLERNRAELEQYIEYKNSAEFKASEAGRLQKLMMEFQKKSGYQEILIANMKVLSKSYQEYSEKLEAANEILIQKYPKAKDMYL
jgi:Predicted transcriptional regulators